MKCVVLLFVAMAATVMARPDRKRSPEAAHLKQVQAKRLTQMHLAADKRTLVKTVKELLGKIEKKDDLECDWNTLLYTCVDPEGEDRCIYAGVNECDGYQDCEDNSDEQFCGQMDMAETTALPEFWESQEEMKPAGCDWRDHFWCLTPEGEDGCFEFAKVCDGFQNCDDNNDEEYCDAMGSGMDMIGRKRHMMTNMKVKALSQKKQQETKEVLPQMNETNNKRNATALTRHLSKKEETRRTLIALLKTIV